MLIEICFKTSDHPTYWKPILKRKKKVCEAHSLICSIAYVYVYLWKKTIRSFKFSGLSAISPMINADMTQKHVAMTKVHVCCLQSQFKQLGSNSTECFRAFALRWINFRLYFFCRIAAYGYNCNYMLMCMKEKA